MQLTRLHKNKSLNVWWYTNLNFLCFLYDFMNLTSNCDKYFYFIKKNPTRDTVSIIKCSSYKNRMYHVYYFPMKCIHQSERLIFEYVNEIKYILNSKHVQ